MDDRRVVVTGVGAITPLGTTLRATLEALAAGRSAVAPAKLFDASGFSCADAAEIRDWDARPAFNIPKALKLTDRPARFAVAAAQMALADANWPADRAARDTLGVAIGSSGSDLQARDLGRALAHDPLAESATDVAVFADRILGRLNPLWLLVSLPNMCSAHVGIQLSARGPNSTIMSDWAAGLQAVGEAAEWIRCGEADAVLAGGADSGVQPFAYAAYEQARLFADGSSGGRFVPSEGAAVLLLEERDAARRRGVQPYAELQGYAARGGSCEGGDSLAAAFRDALSAAGWQARDVSLCTVAAPPITAFERTARSAIETVLGNVQARAVFEPKLGHPLAAAGPLDVALTLTCNRAGRGQCAATPATMAARVLASAIGFSGEAVVLALEGQQPS